MKNRTSCSSTTPSQMVLAFLFSFTLLIGLVSASPMSLKLERAFPNNHGMNLSQLIARDMHRHGRMLLQSSIVNFPVMGTSGPATDGLYYTKVQLGSPPRDFNVLIDTGSDIMWVSCVSCNGCPQTSGLQIQLNFFDLRSSSTSSVISCSDQRCKNGAQSKEAICPIHNNECSYTIHYQDGSATSGFYISDLMGFANNLGGSKTTSSSVPVVFGCTNLRSGGLTRSEIALDGIFGFGQHGMSVISQLYSQGIAPRVFSHCLKGDGNGGGVLVLGEIVEPNIIYSPLIPSQPHYNLYLQSISVNGNKLKIDPSVFATSRNRGVIIDSGTTLAYLAEAAYNPFVRAITASIPQSAHTVFSEAYQCYLVTTSVDDVFPQVSLNFAGGASLVLRPHDYLIHQNPVFNGAVWCLGFQKSQDITILGELVLKDKIFVYDLAGQQIGWANYDCSLPLNVSTSTSKGKSDAGKPSGNASLQVLALAFLMYITLMLI